MNAPLMPPASPGDTMRPATAADIVANPITHAAWLDYANDLHQRAIARGHRALNRYLGNERPSEDVPIICDARFDIVWASPHGADDHRPTFAEAIDAYCIRQRVSITKLGKQYGADSASAYRVRRCNAVASQLTRETWSHIIGMRPNDLRWPITVTRNEAQS